jgi:sensor histidine kinase YesM
MPKKTVQLFIHILGCIVFLCLPILFSPDFSNPLTLFKIPPFQRDFIGYVILVLFFYLNYYVLIPKFYFDKKYITFSTIIIACYLFVSIVPHILIPSTGFQFSLPERESIVTGLQNSVPAYRIHHMKKPFFRFFNQHFFEFLIVFTLSLMLKINNRLKMAEKEKVNAELSYLKAQINPHFLFNTLNSIYSLAIEKSDYTATAVVKLSGMMRYVITDASHKFVSLEKEINYISDYIELQKIRLDESIKLSYSVTGDASGKNIAPLVLISFIENAFKYGVNAEENSDLKIHIDITKGYVHLRVFNKKVKIQQINTHTSGLGIENTSNRLQLLYPGRHKLVIKDNKDDFSILLSLHIK